MFLLPISFKHDMEFGNLCTNAHTMLILLVILTAGRKFLKRLNRGADLQRNTGITTSRLALSLPVRFLQLLGDDMIRRFNSGLPSIFCGRMRIERPLLSFSQIHVLAIRASWDSIIIPEQASPSQFRNQKLCNVDKRPWFDCVRLGAVSKWPASGAYRNLQC